MAMVWVRADLWMVRCIVPSLNHITCWRDLIARVFLPLSINPIFVDVQVGAINQSRNSLELRHSPTQAMYVVDNLNDQGWTSLQLSEHQSDLVCWILARSLVLSSSTLCQ